jgi:hypothetical protein
MPSLFFVNFDMHAILFENKKVKIQNNPDPSSFFESLKASCSYDYNVYWS